MCFLCEHTWEANADGTDDDGQKANFDGRRVRKCPKCQAPIEKNGGCNHMHCTRCGRHFDWTASQSAGDPNAAASHDASPREGGFQHFDPHNLFGGHAQAVFGQVFGNMQNWQQQAEEHHARAAEAHAAHQEAHARAEQQARAAHEQAQQQARAAHEAAQARARAEAECVQTIIWEIPKIEGHLLGVSLSSGSEQMYICIYKYLYIHIYIYI